MSGTTRTLTLLASAAAGFLVLRRLRRHPAELAGKVVVITGGSRGLGLLLARELADRGCRLAICARDEQELQRAAAELEARGTEVLALPCDVSSEIEVDAFVERVTARFGAVDVLVNNAGIIQTGPLESMTLEDFREAMEINFWGAVHTTLAVLPQMRARGRGRIVNITSIGGRVAVPHLLPYDCSKFALLGFSEGLRSELAQDGITVTTVVPGLMRTGSPVNAFFKGQHAREYTWFSLGSATPLTAMDARRAARRIVEATARGEAEVTLTWQARTLSLVHGLFPGATADALGLVNRALPDAGTDGRRNVPGMKLATTLSPSPLTTMMNRAAIRNNEFGGQTEPSSEHARKVGLR